MELLRYLQRVSTISNEYDAIADTASTTGSSQTTTPHHSRVTSQEQSSAGPPAHNIETHGEPETVSGPTQFPICLMAQL